MIFSKPSDTCECRSCTYPNGVFILILAQILMLAASLFSLFVVCDCQFVTVDAAAVDPILTAIFHNESIPVQPNKQDRGLGFFVWEDVDGKCTYEHNYNITEASWKDYENFLGSDWNAARAMACYAAFFAWAVLIWLLVFSCVAHPKVIRYILVGVLIVLMPIFQSIPFLVMGSDFCNENDCQIGRSAIYSAVAVGLYVITGILLLFSKDYPGARNAPQNSDKPNEEGTVAHRDEEEPRHYGFTYEREGPVASELGDVSLVESTATTTKATNAKATIY
jgi:hypothetical protein